MESDVDPIKLTLVEREAGAQPPASTVSYSNGGCPTPCPLNLKDAIEVVCTSGIVCSIILSQRDFCKCFLAIENLISRFWTQKKMSRLVCQLPDENGQICGRHCWPSTWRRHLRNQHSGFPVSLIFVTDEAKLYPANESTLRFLETNRLIGRRIEICTTSEERIRRRAQLVEELARLEREQEELDNQEQEEVEIHEIHSD